METDPVQCDKGDGLVHSTTYLQGPDSGSWKQATDFWNVLAGCSMSATSPASFSGPVLGFIRSSGCGPMNLTPLK